MKELLVKFIESYNDFTDKKLKDDNQYLSIRMEGEAVSLTFGNGYFSGVLVSKKGEGNSRFLPFAELPINEAVEIFIKDQEGDKP